MPRRFLLAAVATLLFAPAAAVAGCFPIARAPAPFVPVSVEAAALPDDASARLTFLGHASFLIESRAGVSAITDYNGYITAATPPTIVTMNNAHATHWTADVEPGVEHVLRGWVPGGGLAAHDLVVEDVRVRNVPTSVRGRGGDRTNSNSIFVFEIEDLCIAHLGHLHHRLQDRHLGELGVIDVLLVPVDGRWTLSHASAAAVVEQVRPAVVVPMHYFGRAVLDAFLAELPAEWTVVEHASPTITLARASLPWREVWVLPRR